MALDKTFYRQVMGCFTTGVAVLTARSQAGVAGLTINSFCSVSLDPPLILVCVDRNSYTLSYFRESGSFAVNILTNEQEHLSRCFATPSEARYEHFCYVCYRQAATGSPIIEGVLAFIDARIVSEHPGGDHVILLGEVQALGVGNHVIFNEQAGAYRTDVTPTDNGRDTTDGMSAPLAYYRGQYRHLALDYRQPSLPAHYKEQRCLVKVS